MLSLVVIFWISCGSNIEKSENEIVSANEDGEITSIVGSREISGIFPHLTTYAHGRINGTYGFGNECGIGALAVWNDKLYMLNYAAHQPKGSEHKLYIVDQNKKVEIFQGSIGGTPAARMITPPSSAPKKTTSSALSASSALSKMKLGSALPRSRAVYCTYEA